MACDAATVQSLVNAVSGLSKLSQRGLLAILANLYGLAVTPVQTAAQAQAIAIAAGYGQLSDNALWQCFLSSICTGACNASTLAVTNEANGYEKLSERALLEGMVAVACMANCNATSLVSSAVANGYERLSERGLVEALVANACKSGCTAKVLYASAIANGYDKFSKKDLWKSVVSTICALGGSGGGGGGFLFTIPTGFTVNSNIHGTILLSNWFLPAPAGVTGAEVWTSTNGVNYTLFSTVAPPTNNQNFAALAVGQFQWTKIRWTNGAGGFSDFTPAQEFSGQAMDWAARCFANAGTLGNISQIKAVNDMWCSLVNAGVSSQILVLNPLAGIADLNSSQTPLIRGAGADPWTQANFNNAASTVNGVVGNNSGHLDPVFTPNNFASAANAGVSVYDITASNTNTYEVGSFDGGTSQATLRCGNGGNVVGCMFASGNQFTAANPGAGFFSMNRVSATDFRLFWGNSTNPLAQIGATLAGANGATNAFSIYTHGLNSSGSPTLLSAHTLSFIAFHNGLTLAQATVLFNAAQAMRVALGGGFV